MENMTPTLTELAPVFQWLHNGKPLSHFVTEYWWPHNSDFKYPYENLLHMCKQKISLLSQKQIIEGIKICNTTIICIDNPTEEMIQLHNMLWKI